MPLVVALAGRRVDAADAETARFPLDAVPRVQGRLRQLLAAQGAAALVCSAACGADLVALEVAQALGLRCRVVLPFAAERFRETSVTDRPGHWGPIYDRVIAGAQAAGDLVILDGAGEGGAAYKAANERIVADALALGGGVPVDAMGVVVWEGRTRGEGDATQGFADLARAQGLQVEEVLTT
jgi:hypothetical protein